MRITVLAAQFPITHSIQQNLVSVRSTAAECQPGDLLVCPAGALSGYDPDLTFLSDTDPLELRAAAHSLFRLAQERTLHIWAGSLIFEEGRWYNAALGFGPQGERYIYHKINQAAHERGVVRAGAGLPIFRLRFPGGALALGAQISRELRFPEQWGWLARRGAQIFLHLNHPQARPPDWPVWRSHLISRAAETQRFVISASGSEPAQTCASLILAPDGSVLAESQPGEETVLRASLDLDLVSNWYLSQSRSDLLRIGPPEPGAPRTRAGEEEQP